MKAMNNGHMHGQNGDEDEPSLAELFDLAQMDALGLLDEPGRVRFEHAFARSPEAIKAQLRAQQNLAVQLAAMTPDVSVPAGQRERVIDRVAAEAAGDRDIIAHLEPAVLPAQGVSRVWRAASIACAAAAIVFAFTTIQMQGRYRELDNAFRTGQVATMFIKEFGPRFETALASPATRFIQFQAVDGQRGAAVVLHDSETGEAQLFCHDLPEKEARYQLVMILPGEERRVVLPVRASGARIAQVIERLDLPMGASLAITRVGGEEQPLLTSINL